MRRGWIGWLVAAIGLAYALRLGEPGWYPAAEGQPAPRTPAYLFDESYTAFSGAQLAYGDARFFEAARRYRYNAPPGPGATDPLTPLLSPRSRGEWSHPPGAPLAMSAAVRAFGFHAWSVRLVSLLAALAALLAVAKLAGRGWLAAVALLATDGYFFVFARTAMPHMLLTAALVVAAALLDRVHASQKRLALVRCLAAGACFGLALSVRWTAAPVIVAILAAMATARPISSWAAVSRLLWILGVAAGVYLLIYSPFFGHGHSLTDLWVLHRKMAWFHSHVESPTGRTSAWYRWPFSLRGVVLGAGGTGDGSWLCVATGNPVLWWLMPVAVLVSVWRMRARASAADWHGRGGPAMVCVAAIVAVWLPWAVLSRRGLSYYLLPAAPFAAVLLSQLVESQRKRRPWLYRTCLAASVTIFAVLYPVLSALRLPQVDLDVYRSVLF